MVQFYKLPKKHDRPKNNKKNASHSNAKNELIHIDSLDHSGNGLVLSTKPITIVTNALPQESCEINIISSNKKVRFAKVVKVIKASEHRQQAFCQYYEKCGGCSLQHTSAENGLKLKAQALASYLEKHAGIHKQLWLPPITSKPINRSETNTGTTGYRRRVRLAVDARRLNSAASARQNLLQIGYRQAQSKDIVNIDHCAIAEPEINRVIGLLQQHLYKMPSIHKIGHLTITVGDNLSQLAVFVVSNLSVKSIHYLSEFADTNQVQVTIINKEGQTQTCGNDQEALIVNNQFAALPSLSETEPSRLALSNDKTIKMRIHPSHFLQVNAGVNHQMLRQAREWIDSFLKVQKSTPSLFDFFCGSGNFTLALADLFDRAVGFEGVSDMVDAARINAELNNVANCDFVSLDLANKDCLKNIQMPKGSVVVLDPSREGASLISEYLVNSGAALIVYVSCNPNSFARDYKLLSSAYQITKISALDMFPYTKHLELMAMLVPK